MRILNAFKIIKRSIGYSPKELAPSVVNIPEVGSLFFCPEAEDYSWSGMVHNIANDYEVKLTIGSSSIKGPTEDQRNEITRLSSQYLLLKDMLLITLKEYLAMKGENLPLDDLERMFFWSEVNLNTKLEWSITLEPSYNVNRSFDFFPKFRLRGNTITWTSLESPII